MDTNVERWHELVRTVFGDGEALEEFSTLELRALLQHAIAQGGEGYVAFRIGLELGHRGERAS